MCLGTVLMGLCFVHAGAESDIQEADRECKRLRPQIRGLSNAMWSTDHKDETYQRVITKRGVLSLTRCDNHGKSQRPRTTLPVVHAQSKGLQRLPERSPALSS